VAHRIGISAKNVVRNDEARNQAALLALRTEKRVAMELTATLIPGLFMPGDLAVHVQAQMRAVG
jgi:hypothetical protein